jgi:hypothetical protein
MLRTRKHSFFALLAPFRRGCQSVLTVRAVLLLSLFTFSALAAESQSDAPTNEQPAAQKDQRADDNQKQPEPANAEPAAAPSIVDFFQLFCAVKLHVNHSVARCFRFPLEPAHLYLRC